MRKCFGVLFIAVLFMTGIICHADNVSDNRGLVVSFNKSGAIEALSISGKEILDTKRFSGFEVEDVNANKRQRITGVIKCSNGSLSFFGENKKLGVRLQSSIEPADGFIVLHTRITDLTKSERAMRVYFSLNVKDLGWNWCEDLNNSYPAVPGKRNLASGGFSGHDQTIYPFSAITSRNDTGLAMGWPMANPRYFTQTFTLGNDGVGKFEISVALGLSSYTAKFPNAADFDTIIYSFDAKDNFRSALAKYYEIYPDCFQTRAKQQGLWTLWLGKGIEDYATRMGALYHEAEFDIYESYNNILRDDKYGYLSYQYTEPWGVYHAVPLGFKDKYPGNFKAGSSLETPLNRQKLEEFVRSDFGDNKPDDRFPGSTRDIVSQTIINTAVECDTKGDWLTYQYFPKQFNYDTDRKGWDSIAFIVNPDPEIPHPNRADLEWDGQIMFVQNKARELGTRLDGIYVDSVMFYMAWDRLNFRRDHWKYTDYPLIYTRLENGKYVPVQALSLCYSDYLKYLRNKIGKFDWPLLANGWSPLYSLCASNIDIMGAGECNVHGPLPDQKFFAEFRAMAFRKPISIMDYALSLSDLGPDPKYAKELVEPRMNHLLMYGIYPGTANSFAPGGDTEEKLKIVTPVFEKYRDIFLKINAAGWEPLRAADTKDSDILLEQWGESTQDGLYYTLYNTGESEKTAVVTIDLKRIKGKPASAKELVTGKDIKVDAVNDACSFSIQIPAKRTIAVHMI